MSPVPPPVSISSDPADGSSMVQTCSEIALMQPPQVISDSAFSGYAAKLEEELEKVNFQPTEPRSLCHGREEHGKQIPGMISL